MCYLETKLPPAPPQKEKRKNNSKYAGEQINYIYILIPKNTFEI